MLFIFKNPMIIVSSDGTRPEKYLVMLLFSNLYFFDGFLSKIAKRWDSVPLLNPVSLIIHYNKFLRTN
jgi:hypothetical protein